MNKFFKVVALILITPIAIHFSYLFDAALFHLYKPKTTPVEVKTPSEPAEKMLLIPLDSRPPCLGFVQKLGKINDIDIIVPSKELLDNYHKPADTKKLFAWLNENIKNTDNAIISTDMLRYGGLIASRTGLLLTNDETFLTSLSDIKNSSDYYMFSIIPRLIIPDDPQTRPWQWHTTVYATKKDIYDHFGHTYDFDDMDGMLKRIPPEIISSFNARFDQNHTFNRKLLSFALSHDINLIFGQDDAQPFGRPYENKLAIEKIIKAEKADHITTSNGADELAMLQLAHHVIKKQKEPVKIFVSYSTAKGPDMLFHFMAEDIKDTVADKINAIGAQTVPDKNSADFILFIHTGDQHTSSASLKAVAQNIKTLLKEKPIALVDLSVNFMQHETILKTLLNENVPLPSLIAYAGWNTAGNSIGTALSQAAIFTASKRSCPDAYMPHLYKTNFEFTINRILDDWAYQKDVQDIIDPMLLWKGIDTYKLEKNKSAVEKQIADSVKRRQKSFFYKNLGRFPFYSDIKKDYYITELSTEITLPWDRTFEIDLNVRTKAGYTER